MFTPGRHYYWKTSLLRNLNETAIDALVEHAGQKTSPISLMVLQQLHGAAGRVGVEDTAFAHRYDHFNCIPVAVWETSKGSDEHIRWAREYWELMQPFVEDACYANDLGEEELETGAQGKPENRVKAAYGEQTYERLVTLKNKYDPTNFFRLNANVEPTPR